MTRQQAIRELKETGWPAVADDLRDGVSPQTILNRLWEIEESDSTAYEIITSIDR